MTEYYCVATFHTTHHALIFEKVLKERNLEVKLMPVPRQVSSSCGTAGEFPCDKRDEVLKICTELHIEIDEVHKIEHERKSNWFTRFTKGK